ncbi:conserved exported hypothetical protein [Nostocoides japonicum T1-X7]|uniref:Lipoprotein n=1 Tax=Nostocoides japonicum T1-X7 TaxID=1194083 RepID=A0A077LUT2_9MICO|nr:hypothetical protein [Tetrasphaera japonica]CCH77346.1 conserved exported hypothetical protein [Tetrasphaera japonica T1-X7]
MKRILAAVVAVSALTLTAACGSSDAGSSGGGSTSSATAAVAAVKVGDTVDLASVMGRSAEAVKAKKTGHMAMSLGSEGTADADVDYSRPSTAMRMSMKASGQTMEFIVVDKTIYLGGGMLSSMSDGKKWIKIDPNGTDALSKRMAPMLNRMDSLSKDPASQFAGLKGVKATVTQADGSSTTYRVTLTKEQLQAQKDREFPGLGGANANTLPDGVEYTITLDKDGLPRTMDTTVSGQHVTVTMSKWGEPVDISAPPAGEVGTFSMPSTGA